MNAIQECSFCWFLLLKDTQLRMKTEKNINSLHNSHIFVRFIFDIIKKTKLALTMRMLLQSDLPFWTYILWQLRKYSRMFTDIDSNTIYCSKYSTVSWPFLMTFYENCQSLNPKINRFRNGIIAENNWNQKYH